jgi:hypothetical protein
LRAAQARYAGVNLHGGGEGYYAPMVAEPDATKLRPEYFGMLLAQKFTGATFTGVSLAGEAPGVNVYAARGKNVLLIAMVKVWRSCAGEIAWRDDPCRGVLEAGSTLARCERRRLIRTRKDG